MKILCISASNSMSGYSNTRLLDKISAPAFNQKENSVKTSSYKICDYIKNKIVSKYDSAELSIIELKNYTMYPCINCIKCYNGKRCAADDQFNEIYETVIDNDLLFIISPHYAPIPSKLCILLEKMEQISFIHWIKDNSYQSEVYGKPAGIISHGGSGEDWALKSYKDVVNDPINNALHTIQLETVPFNNEWNSGISIDPQKVDDENSKSKLILDEYIEKVLSRIVK